MRAWLGSLLLVLFVLTGVRVFAQEPVFEDPKIRGSLVQTETPNIPLRFHGLWAMPRAACSSTGDYGVKIEVEAARMGRFTVMRVQGYKYDPTAVMIDLDGGPNERSGVFFELSLDSQMLRAKRLSSAKPMPLLLHRCPVGY